MDLLCSYADRPLAFFARYIRRRAWSHALILIAVLGAVGCSVSAQYGVKFLVDTLSGTHRSDMVWFAFALPAGSRATHLSASPATCVATYFVI